MAERAGFGRVTTYRCCHPECPGYPYRASDRAHPPDTCTDEGRRVAAAPGRVSYHAANDDDDDDDDAIADRPE